MEKTILITGASSGFGFITTKILAKAGHKVFASMRGVDAKNKEKADELRTWALQERVFVEPIELDVMSSDSAKAAADYIHQSIGHIDVLINNAGMLVFGITEAFTADQLLNVFNVNTVGTHRVNQAVLPYMREQEDGLLIYVGSVTANIISPFQGPYVASKAAQDKLAETTHYEVSRFGIDSVIIQPGAYTQGTNHFPGAQKPNREDVVKDYTPIETLPDELVGNLQRIVAEGEEAHVEDIAKAILYVIETPKGERNFRMVIDPQHHGAEPINEVAQKMQGEFMERLGIKDLMQVKQ
ncbi:SDR family oxidoreductase [Ulvibacterium sp.]|uniref:SDR family oxidoreductase n=1 Tax=Ulvibacterium sp. TaxID=2665914 RepID=UPI00261A78BD|nr:SDR family oxidoreductase [Ulvibacterium sp.]